MSCMHVRLSFSSVNSVTRVNYITHIENYAFYDNLIFSIYSFFPLFDIHYSYSYTILDEMH